MTIGDESFYLAIRTSLPLGCNTLLVKIVQPDERVRSVRFHRNKEAWDLQCATRRCASCAEEKVRGLAAAAGAEHQGTDIPQFGLQPFRQPASVRGQRYWSWESAASV